MLGNFNNDEAHLQSLGPTSLSTAETGHHIARCLQIWTSKRWIVTLNLEREPMGGFFVSPPEGRKKRGLISPADWQDLEEIFGAVPTFTSRYYILPDEIEHVLKVLDGESPRVSYKTKVDKIEERVLGNR